MVPQKLYRNTLIRSLLSASIPGVRGEEIRTFDGIFEIAFSVLLSFACYSHPSPPRKKIPQRRHQYGFSLFTYLFIYLFIVHFNSSLRANDVSQFGLLIM